MKYIQLFIALALMLGCTLSRKNRNVYGGGWSAVHSDSRNSDYSEAKGGHKVSLIWHKKFDGTINLGPSADTRGRVYVTTSGPGCHLFALDARNGNELWCTDKINKFAVASSVLIDNRNRLFIADDSAMHAFDDSGNLLWRKPIKGFPLSAQFTHTGKLLFITHVGNVYVLDRGTGAALIDGQPLSSHLLRGNDFDPIACMKGTEDCPCANTLAYDTRSGTFFFTYWQPGTSNASLWAMKYAEQNNKALVTKLWENNELPGGSATSPDISADGKKVYINDNTGHLYALNSTTGQIVWQYNLGYNPGGSQSTSPGGYIIPSGANGAGLICLKDEGNSARLVWHADSLINKGIATQTAGHLAYATVTSENGRFYNDLLVMDVRNGRILDKHPLPGKSYFTVGTTIGPEGNIYIPSFNGHLYAFKGKK
ncbi:outer membrane protein assembly factor BamB family protein [Parafilimonas sp.]|uniref:outer membrane protein assembly factor BamB family protein n=1 Tax=Parafilimonas sp. TaxID=1969739 RepID=UPI003F7EE5EE